MTGADRQKFASAHLHEISKNCTIRGKTKWKSAVVITTIGTTRIEIIKEGIDREVLSLFLNGIEKKRMIVNDEKIVKAHHLAVLQALTRLLSLQVQAMDQFTPKKAERKK